MKSLRKRATVVVLEGIDGSGKTTLGRRLTDVVIADGRRAQWYPNQNLSPVRAALDGIAREQDYADRFEMLGRDEAQFLAAVLKLRDMMDLGDDFDDPDLVMIMDRYYHSHLALARVQRTTNEARLRLLYSALPRPDLLMLVRVSPAVGLERVRLRGTDANTMRFLAEFATAYDDLAHHDPSFTVISGERPADEVLVDAWARTRAVLARA